ncbi:hypothetical protein CGCF415_v014252 [Colletotrichum fructicola]|nr:hypothetical protein CFRS1_v000084 [Colletotrichum fructicola]KAF4884125.1 hypothetical protein CGCFRS4_v012979 [Colletotrichum fructicola]KAF4889055.1 hypothetical protein CGCF415_v014252 [Colletotrichum fructicola]KAF4923726.1 hypothetical protein CGCF245_v014832 [Colletotrichum fructicola]
MRLFRNLDHTLAALTSPNLTATSTTTPFQNAVSAVTQHDNLEDTCPKDTVMCHLPHNWNCCPSTSQCCGAGCCIAGSHCVDLLFGRCCPDGKRLCGSVCVAGECCGKGGCGARERCCGGGICCKEGEVCDYGKTCVRSRTSEESGAGRGVPNAWFGWRAAGVVVVAGVVGAGWVRL